MAEMLKWGGEEMKRELGSLVKNLWSRAREKGAIATSEEEWPEEWRESIIVPIWKRKGELSVRRISTSVRTKIFGRWYFRRWTSSSPLSSGHPTSLFWIQNPKYNKNVY